MECEESLGLGTVDRSAIQVLTGVNRLDGLIFGIREGSADSNTKGALTLRGGDHDNVEAMDPA